MCKIKKHLLGTIPIIKMRGVLLYNVSGEILLGRNVVQGLFRSSEEDDLGPTVHGIDMLRDPVTRVGGMIRVGMVFFVKSQIEDVATRVGNGVDILLDPVKKLFPAVRVVKVFIGKVLGFGITDQPTHDISPSEFDLVIDENDLSVKELGKNVAVVISDNSFSCGNLLPCSLNSLDPEVLLLGQQSGGGSCSVGYISNAIGSIMQISSENMLVTMKNGYIRDIDSGVTPHIPLSANKMFDREYIAGAVNDYFG